MADIIKSIDIAKEQNKVVVNSATLTQKNYINDIKILFQKAYSAVKNITRPLDYSHAISHSETELKIADFEKNTSQKVSISLQNVTKLFNNDGETFAAIDDVSIDIFDNEFFTILGPSGCGKSTLIRAIAGFEQIDAGVIKLGSKHLENMPANRRNVNTVFQSYNLFPHLSVKENIAFSLRMKKMPADYIDKKVKEVLNVVRLEKLANRMPSDISGGQKQRVALARAIAGEPEVLLLDEPLSALDYKLRKQMQSELKRIQIETGITFIFITHDQEEAMSMSDRIAILNDGKVQQVDKPNAIYENPVNIFTAEFIGEINILDVTWRKENGKNIAHFTKDFEISIAKASPKKKLGIRPEKISLNKSSKGIPGVIIEQDYQGIDTLFTIEFKNKKTIQARIQHNTGNENLKVGSKVKVTIPKKYIRVINTK